MQRLFVLDAIADSSFYIVSTWKKKYFCLVADFEGTLNPFRFVGLELSAHLLVDPPLLLVLWETLHNTVRTCGKS